LVAEELSTDRFVLNGFSPWVTAAPAADVIVLGATLADGRQLLAAVRTDQQGVTTSAGESLVALSASCTGRVELQAVEINAADIVAGPVENVMATNSGGGAGGLQTSTLAIGQSMAAASFLRQQAIRRPDLLRVTEKISADVSQLQSSLLHLTSGQACSINADELRRQANLLVLRSTQAALSAAKGAGFVASHAVGRWACEALFFLVWSCPQGVAHANLCELAQLSD
jgi:alkylation response protein AidB-like acyl-CoA dehydrogenase